MVTVLLFVIIKLLELEARIMNGFVNLTAGFFVRPSREGLSRRPGCLIWNNLSFQTLASVLRL